MSVKNKKFQIISLLLGLSISGMISGCTKNTGTADENTTKEAADEIVDEDFTQDFDFIVDYEGIERVANDASKAEVHDPSVIKADGKYYIFGSHMTAAVSDDLSSWKMVAKGYTDKNVTYGDMKNMKSGEFDFTGYAGSVIPTESKAVNIWAPDVIYNKAQGLYVMYGCTSSTFNASTIYMATSENIEGPYEWKTNILYSGEIKDNIDKTDILDYVSMEDAVAKYTSNAGFAYNYKKYPNCIDPTVFYDKDGKMWMVYGSWSGGIFLLEIDEETGLVIHPEQADDKNVDTYYGKRLIGGGHYSIEGPYILYDELSDYYYLFVSYGELKRDGGYQIRVFRSKTVDGDYVDMNDAAPDAKIAHEFTGLKLSGNYYLPSLNVGYKATGHNSAFIDDDGKHYIIYHTRFDKGSESHTPRAKQYFLNAEGWPCMLPYMTSGETISDAGYSQDEVVGRYYMINQGMAIDDKVAEPFIIYLLKDGSLKGEKCEGSWSMTDGSYFMNINVDDKDYSGVFCKMKDEAGSEVMTLTAVGNNESVWGVKY